MATEEHEPLVAVNVSVDGSQKMAGFEVSINGRFWVSTEAETAAAGWPITPRRSVVACCHVHEAEHNPSRNVYAAAQNRRLGR
jgi:hypothetical protein